MCLTPYIPQSHRVYDMEGNYPSLNANSHGGQNQQAVLIYHDNGGNEQFEVRGGAMLTVKASSDPHMSHNILCISDGGACDE